MSLNNSAIFNATLVGAVAGITERWINSTVQSSYDSMYAAATKLAVAVDSMIAPTDITDGEAALLRGIVEGVFANRFPQSSQDFNDIAKAIVACFNDGITSLEGDGEAYVIRNSLADLVARDNKNLPNGCLAYVIAEGCNYQLDTLDPLTTYSPLIIARSSGTGKWYRKSRAFVVLNFTLWVQSYDFGVVGYTPGQLLASGHQEADIAIDFSQVFHHDGNQQGMIPDNQGNMWTFEDANSFFTLWVYKVLAKDTLRSGRAVPVVTLNVPIIGPVGTEAGGGAFDQNNNLWVMNGPHGTFGWSTAVRYSPQEAAVTGGLPSFTIGAEDSPGTSSNQQDIIFDPEGNMWMSYAFSSKAPGANGGFLMFSKAQLQVGGTNLVPAKQWTGSNFTGPGLAATCQIAFDQLGRIWATDYNGLHIRCWDPAEPTGNPAPLVVLSGPALANGPYGIAFDVDGNMWICSGNANELYRIPKAQLVTGNPVPDIVITPTTTLLEGKMCFANTPGRCGIQPSGWPVVP